MGAAAIPIWVEKEFIRAQFPLIKADTDLLLGMEVIGGIAASCLFWRGLLPWRTGRMESDWEIWQESMGIFFFPDSARLCEIGGLFRENGKSGIWRVIHSGGFRKWCDVRGVAK